MRIANMMSHLALALTACEGVDGDSWRLDRAECEQWVDRFLHPPGGPSPWDDLAASGDESDAALVERTRSELMARCLDGGADRDELACLQRATTDRGHLLCVVESERRRKQRERPRRTW